MYCLKCKTHTPSNNIYQKYTSNGRRLLVAQCKSCGITKTKFVSSKNGQGIFNKMLSTVGNAVGEMHLPAIQGEYVPDGSFNDQRNYSYCGPGTKYSKRNQEGYQGINELDKMCKLHDQFYSENKDTASRNISDEALAHRAYEIANDSRFDRVQRNMANIVYHIMKNKARFGLGIGSKNVRKGPVKI